MEQSRRFRKNQPVRNQPVVINSNVQNKPMGTASYAERMAASKPSAPPNQRKRPPQQRPTQPPQSRRPTQPPQNRRPTQPPQKRPPPQSYSYRGPPQPPKFNPESLLSGPNEKFGKVRRVLSGDSIEVDFKGDERMKIVSLDGIRAPRILRSERDENVFGKSEDLYAWESREFLRSTLIHQIVRVKFFDNSSSEKKGGRAVYGSVLARPADIANRPLTETDEWFDVALLSLEKGLSHLKTDLKNPNELYAKAQEAAQANEMGRWKPKAAHLGRNDQSWMRHHLREVEWDPDTTQLFEKYKGQSLPGIIEDVSEGTRVKVELIFDDSNGIRTKQIWLELSGVHSPKADRKIQNKKTEGEKFGETAKKFTLVRIQHCDVKVVLDAIDSSGNLFGHIEFHRGDIATYLLKNGLATVVPWTAQATGKIEEYKRWERLAIEKSVGVWSDENFRNKPRCGRQGCGVVKEVTSGDSMLIQEDQESEPVRIYLASIQAPRRKAADRGHPEPFYAEAKEYVRKNLISKNVEYVVEYQRKNQGNKRNKDKNRPKTNYVTVMYTDQNGVIRNLNNELVERGLCKMVRHKKNEPRSVHYCALQELQKKAENASIGVWSPPHKIPKPETDYTLVRTRKGKQNDAPNPIYEEALGYCEDNLGFLTRSQKQENSRKRRETREQRRLRNTSDGDDGQIHAEPLVKSEITRVPAICAYVYNAERMKVRLTNDNVLCNMVCANINVDKKFTQVATSFVKDLISQQEIEVEVERLDRSAKFIGHVFYQDGAETKNLSQEILRRGWAALFEPKAGYSKHMASLKAAVQEAKENKLGLWENYEEPVPEPVTEENQQKHGGNAEENDGQQEHHDGQQKPVARERTRYRDRGDRGDRRGDRRGRGRGRGDRGDRQRGRGRDRERRPRAKNVEIEPTVIEDGVTFYCREKNLQLSKRVEACMTSIDPTTIDFDQNWTPDRNMVCAGLYSDGKYYRCKIINFGKKEEEESERMIKVRWIDFGEVSHIQQALILPIHDKGVADIVPLAKKCKLAHLKPPPESAENYFSEAINFFITALQGSVIKYDVIGRNREFSLVVVKVDGENINDRMVRAGYSRVIRGKNNDEYVTHLLELESDAKMNHWGQFEYGDLDSDDETDKRERGRGRN